MANRMVYDPSATTSNATAAGAGGTAGDNTNTGAGANVPFIVGLNSQPMMPWLNNAFSADFDYNSLGDGFAQAMDMTLGGFMDGTLSTEDGVRYVMNPDPAWGFGGGMSVMDGGYGGF
ncbi:hypothetical protein QBC35DRAFT_186111 [Podospora australis]|uniref:Uncharacterized protein n=1 Tax=Podospora australis TaxID=1536484 RepID=A0AAN7AD79_9PEZI|nr:hypothetical protein QBC35DRAFT_186111 [Podospora australis]